jgi:hypothetical protein
MTEDYHFIPGWPNYMEVDWGYTNPLAAVEFQISPLDEIFVWREYYHKYKTLPDVTSELRARPNPAGYHLDLIVADPADPEAAASLSKLMNVGCWAPKELKSDYTWRDGIDLMSGFMHPVQIASDKWGAPIDSPRYHVAWECKNHIRELNNYRSKEPVKGQNVPELGNKVEDHTIDAMRYALLATFRMGARGAHLTSDMVNAAPVESTPRARAARRTLQHDMADMLAGTSGSAGIFRMGEEVVF